MLIMVQVGVVNGVEKSNAAIFSEFGLIRPKFECFVNTEWAISKKINGAKRVDPLGTILFSVRTRFEMRRLRRVRSAFWLNG